MNRWGTGDIAEDVFDARIYDSGICIAIKPHFPYLFIRVINRCAYKSIEINLFNTCMVSQFNIF